MTYGVVIPTLNEAAYVGDLLDDLGKQTDQPAQILVVDGGSRDTTRSVVRRYPVRLTTGKRSVALQRNQGAAQMNTDYILFCDADVRLSPDSAKRLVQAADHLQASIAVPWLLPTQTHWLTTPIYLLFSTIFFLTQWFLPSGAGSCLLVRTDLFSAVGGFDATYRFEDIELIRRAARRGKFRVLPVVVRVSDRRFHEQGILRLLATYLVLSLFFCVGAFRSANRIQYRFGHHHKPSGRPTRLVKSSHRN